MGSAGDPAPHCETGDPDLSCDGARTSGPDGAFGKRRPGDDISADPPIVLAVSRVTVDELSIVTERLRLTPIVAGDTDDLFAVLSDTRLYEFIGGKPATRIQLRRRFAMWERRGSPDGRQLWLNWAVRLGVDGAAVGYVQATVDDDRASIGYVIGTAWSGRGIASEAVIGMREWLRSVGVSRLEAHIHPAHRASAAVARRAGLTSVGDLDADGEEIWRSEL
jgi:RimJ/RimL family protein N-acetyltransferase